MAETIQTTIDEVTVFADRALIVRRGSMTGGPGERSGEAEIIIDGLPLMLDDTSVRVHFEDNVGRKIQDIRLGLVRRDERSGDDTVVHDEDEQLTRAIEEQTSLMRSQRLVISEIRRWLEADMPPPPVRDGRTQEKPPFPVDGWRASVDILSDMLHREHTLYRDYERQLRDLVRERSARQAARLLPERRGVDDPARRWSKRLSLRYTLEVSDHVATDAAIVVSYTINGARWAPCYTVNLEDGRATLDMGIRVVQFTGEDWSGVRLRCSAASLQRQVQLPELPSKRIGRTQPLPPASLRSPAPVDEDLFSGFKRWDSQSVRPRIPSAEEAYPDFLRLATTLLRDGEGLLERYTERDSFADAAAIDRPKKSMRRPDHVSAPMMSPPPPPEPAPMVRPPAPPTASPQLAKRKAAPGSTPKMARGDLDMKTIMPADEADDGCSRSREEAEECVPLAESSFGIMAFPSSIDVREMAKTGGFASEREIIVQAGAISTSPADVVDYRSFEMRGPDEAERGSLVQIPKKAVSDQKFSEAMMHLGDGVRQLASPGPMPDSSFFHVFESPAGVDVLADGALYRVSMAEKDAAATMRYVSSPMLESKVFRILNVVNPFDHPLPAGDVAFYRQGTFIFRTSLERTDLGSTIGIPLGVEEGIRISRNVRYEEEQSGVISSSSILLHHVEIEVKSQLQTTITLDILERIPVTSEDTKTIDIDELKADPVPRAIAAWEGKPLRGGRLFTVTLEPGEKKVCRYSYRVTIPAKMELIGGNRRA